MKKTIITVIITAVVSVGLTMLCVNLYNVNEKNSYKDQTEKLGIKETKEVDFEIPDFAIILEGIYDSTITDEDVKELKVYEISTVMTDGVYTDLYTYKGIKLIDAFNLFDYSDYNNLIVKSNGNLQVTYSKEEITDNMYLVFSVDGHMLPAEEPVNLLNPDLNSRYSIGNVVSMQFE